CGVWKGQGSSTDLGESPMGGERVVYLGSVGPADRARILGGSAALLHPIEFAEPFGLSVGESMAWGAAGVGAHGGGSRRGGVDEGVTGRLAGTVDEAVEAVADIAGMDRGGCRVRARE